MKEHDDPPACANCDHFSYGSGGQCFSDSCSTFNLIRGREPTLAKDAREDGPCGRTGHYFTPRPISNRFVAWADRYTGAAIVLFWIVGTALACWVGRH